MVITFTRGLERLIYFDCYKLIYFYCLSGVRKVLDSVKDLCADAHLKEIDGIFNQPASCDTGSAGAKQMLSQQNSLAPYSAKQPAVSLPSTNKPLKKGKASYALIEDKSFATNILPVRDLNAVYLYPESWRKNPELGNLQWL